MLRDVLGEAPRGHVAPREAPRGSTRRKALRSSARPLRACDACGRAPRSGGGETLWRRMPWRAARTAGCHAPWLSAGAGGGPGGLHRRQRRCGGGPLGALHPGRRRGRRLKLRQRPRRRPAEARPRANRGAPEGGLEQRYGGARRQSGDRAAPSPPEDCARRHHRAPASFGSPAPHEFTSPIP